MSTKQNRTEQNRTEQNRTEQNRTEQNRTEQNRTEQNRTEQNRTEQNRTEQKMIFIFTMKPTRSGSYCDLLQWYINTTNIFKRQKAKYNKH
jgi:hypothetical protein